MERNHKPRMMGLTTLFSSFDTSRNVDRPYAGVEASPYVGGMHNLSSQTGMRPPAYSQVSQESSSARVSPDSTSTSSTANAGSPEADNRRDEDPEATTKAIKGSPKRGTGGGKRHKVSKGKTQKFVCTGYEKCSLSFTRSEHLARHIRKHTGEKPFTCFCSRSFSRMDNLRQHASTVHSEDELPPDWEYQLNAKSLRARTQVSQRQAKRLATRRRNTMVAVEDEPTLEQSGPVISTPNIESMHNQVALSPQSPGEESPQSPRLRSRPEPIRLPPQNMESYGDFRSNTPPESPASTYNAAVWSPSQMIPPPFSSPSTLTTPTSATFPTSPYASSYNSGYPSSVHTPTTTWQEKRSRRLSMPFSFTPDVQSGGHQYIRPDPTPHQSGKRNIDDADSEQNYLLKRRTWHGGIPGGFGSLATSGTPADGLAQSDPMSPTLRRLANTSLYDRDPSPPSSHRNSVNLPSLQAMMAGAPATPTFPALPIREREQPHPYTPRTMPPPTPAIPVHERKLNSPGVHKRYEHSRSRSASHIYPPPANGYTSPYNFASNHEITAKRESQHAPRVSFMETLSDRNDHAAPQRQRQPIPLLSRNSTNHVDQGPPVRPEDIFEARPSKSNSGEASGLDYLATVCHIASREST